MASMVKRLNPDAPMWREHEKPRRRPGLRQATPERAKELAEYSKRRRVYLAEGTFCHFATCKNMAVEVHHKNGRNGDRLLDQTDWMAVCRLHHKFIHDYPNAARELGYLK